MELNTCSESESLVVDDRNILCIEDHSCEIEDSLYEIGNANLSYVNNQKNSERKKYRAWIGARGLHLL